MIKRNTKSAKKLAGRVKSAPKARIKRSPKGSDPLSIGILIGVIVVLAAGSYLLASLRGPRSAQQGLRQLADETPLVSETLAAEGKIIYDQHCAGCHGQDAVGENPDNIYEQDAQGNFVAPPLNGTAHSWHHTDEDLVDSILNGSERNPRMRAFEDTLTRDDAVAAVEYIKSFWQPGHFTCQGPAHMSPECQPLMNN